MRIPLTIDEWWQLEGRTVLQVLNDDELSDLKILVLDDLSLAVIGFESCPEGCGWPTFRGFDWSYVERRHDVTLAETGAFGTLEEIAAHRVEVKRLNKERDLRWEREKYESLKRKFEGDT